VISKPSNETSDGETSESAGLDVSLSSAADDDTLANQNQRISVGRSLSRAVQVARSTGQVVADRGRRRRTDSGTDISIGSADDESRSGLQSVDDGIDNTSGHGRFVGQSLTRAAQAARVTGSIAKTTGQIAKKTGQAVVDRGRRIRSDLEDEEGAGRRQQVQPVPGSSGEITLDSSPRGRRQQIRSRFAGVGQATKRGFGSALQAARQKGRDVATNTRTRIAQGGDNDTNIPVDPAPFSLNAIQEHPGNPSGESNEEDDGWSCTACTLDNEGGRTECAVCGTPRAQFTNSSSLSKSSNTEVFETNDSEAPTHTGSSEIETDHRAASPGASEIDKVGAQDVGDLLLGPNQDPDNSLRSESENSAPRPGMKHRLGAAVRSVRIGKGNQESPITERGSGRFGIRRRRNYEATSDAPSSARLRNVRLSGPLTLPPHPIHGGKLAPPEIPTKRLDGCWIAHVEPVSIAKDVVSIQKESSAEMRQIVDAATEEESRSDETSLTAKEQPDIPATKPSSVGPEISGGCQGSIPEENGLLESREAGGLSESSKTEAAANEPIIPTSPDGHVRASAEGNEQVSSGPGDDLVHMETQTPQEEDLPDRRSSAYPNMEDAEVLDFTTPSESIARESISLESTFRIQIGKRNFADDSSDCDEVVTEVTKNLSEILECHTMISESITFASIPSLELPQFDEDPSRKGETGKTIAAYFGLSTVDAVRVTGKVLMGLLETSQIPESEPFNKCCGKFCLSQCRVRSTHSFCLC